MLISTSPPPPIKFPLIIIDKKTQQYAIAHNKGNHICINILMPGITLYVNNYGELIDKFDIVPSGASITITQE